MVFSFITEAFISWFITLNFSHVTFQTNLSICVLYGWLNWRYVKISSSFIHKIPFYTMITLYCVEQVVVAWHLSHETICKFLIIKNFHETIMDNSINKTTMFSSFCNVALLTGLNSFIPFTCYRLISIHLWLYLIFMFSCINMWNEWINKNYLKFLKSFIYIKSYYYP